jgi:titin
MVQGNLIGTNSLGTAAVGNLSYGVVIGGGASNNTIDGVNTISGNALDGILMASPGTIHNEVNDNAIGLNAAGNGALPNGMSGVTIGSGASANGVDNNFISGNSGDGIHLSGAGTEGNEIRTNFIGLEFDETTALPNTSGIFIDSGASDNAIGGPSKGNTIADNADAGIAITGKTSIGNTISQNSIFGNDGLGIDLGNTGTPTANTPVGAQAGPNDLLNHPVLTAGTANGTVDVSFNSTPNTPFKIELFASSTGTPGQGQIYLGSVNVVTAASGEADFTYFFNPTATDPYLTATATEGGTHKNTSEFSAPLELSEST